MQNLDHASGECLLERSRCGDEAAFQRLYERHRDATFRFAYMMLGSAEKAEDVTHDCFVSLIQNSKKFDPSRASLRMYLYSATRNLAAKSFCDTASEVALDDLKAARVSGTSEQPLRNLLHQELSGEIQKAISQMPPLQREVVVLFEYQEQSLTEIAAIVGADLCTVKSRLHRARERLRRELAALLDGDAHRGREESNHER